MAQAGANFNQSAALAAPPDAVVQAIVAGTTGAPEYTVMVVGPGTVVLTRKYRPTWVIVVAVIGILLFLLGLLALAYTTTETLTVNVTPVEGGGSRVTVSGVASMPMLHRLAAIINGMPQLAAPGPGGYRMPAAQVDGTAAFAAQPPAITAESQTPTTYEPGWYPDPRSRFERRYYDGIEWTAHVLNGTAAAVDPL